MALIERSAIWPWKGDVPPHLPKPDVMPKAFLLPGDPGRVDKAEKVLSDFQIIGQNREYRMGTGTYNGVLIGICSTGIGGASTEIAMVELAAMGVRYAVRTGGMGALADDLNLGDFLIAGRALANSGVARHYAPEGEFVMAHEEMTKTMNEAREALGLPGRVGTCVTADGYYRAQGRPSTPGGPAYPSVLDDFMARGADGAEMEAEVVFACGGALGMCTSAVMAVHAHRRSNGWLEDYEGTQTNVLRLGAEAASRAVLAGF
ncbi:phosphorylase [Rhodobacteraceae bacterium RKSG542]|uniref:nucleoside phosphorylase n=1 Tax=Pseudovibrio flavus TaxID=2529854 RepID=UPI0012BBCCB7|nr:nucleoside phosphorylase [Pseudovibrio flavus]MTI17359.1 phosphorylase [Pseudovibrio flavus]